MRKEWPKVRLSEVSEINPKLENKNSISQDFEVQFLPMALVEEVSNKIHLLETRKFSEVQKKSYTYFAEGDVLFAKVTPCMENGKIAIAKGLKNKIGFGSSEFHVFRPNKEIEKEFLFYFLVQSKFRNEAQHEMTGAVGLRRVPKHFLENYPFPIPPLPEQRAIVARIEELFSELDHSIANLQTALSKLEVYRQAVLKKAFEGGFISEKIKRSEANLPLNWSWKSIKQISSVLGDGLHGTPKYSENGEYYFINGNNLNDRKIEIKQHTKRVDKSEFEKYKKPLNERTVFVSINGTLGNTAFYNNEKVILGKSACYFNLVESVSKEYVFYVLKTNRFLNYANTEATGSTIKNVSLKSMRSFLIPLPSFLEEQILIVQEIESRLSVADKLAETIQTNLLKSESLRQSILKKSFEGKLLTESELEACRKEADWESAERLLESITNNNNKNLKR
ncbi:restriction endonuclease subunit S [Aquiflexum sp.]|uniref:restriction endonuclease subunit S n=1 Tax=Aquiflexum sp. TaxID=1872584 RepID=UPI003593DC11